MHRLSEGPLPDMTASVSLLSNAHLFELSPHHVDEGDRIGFLHEDKAAALGRLMAVDGQRDPIKVVGNPKNPEKPWRLVTGMHRLIGAQVEGITVWAIEVSGKPEALADLEASENLHRRPLEPLERAKFVAALCEAAQERIARQHGQLRQQQLAVKARWDRVKAGIIRPEQALQEESDDTVENISTVYGWQDSAADALGFGKRTIRNALELYRLVIEPFPAELVRALADRRGVGDNASQLKLIADVKDEGERRKVIEALVENTHLTAEMARVQIGLDSAKTAAPTKDVKFASTISDSWSRLSTGAKRDYLPRFVGMLTPGLKHQLRELLEEEMA